MWRRCMGLSQPRATRCSLLTCRTFLTCRRTASASLLCSSTRPPRDRARPTRCRSAREATCPWRHAPKLPCCAPGLVRAPACVPWWWLLVRGAAVHLPHRPGQCGAAPCMQQPWRTVPRRLPRSAAVTSTWTTRPRTPARCRPRCPALAATQCLTPPCPWRRSRQRCRRARTSVCRPQACACPASCCTCATPPIRAPTLPWRPWRPWPAPPLRACPRRAAVRPTWTLLPTPLGGRCGTTRPAAHPRPPAALCSGLPHLA
mmetsp:Transcript_35612/g.89496  ORF Transcript_35612/g.89496 Transcript_35612/m.89496 type:complete len:259 (-) Transcript_35612:62-838(-)